MYECVPTVNVCVFAFSEPLNLPVLVRHASHWTLPNQSSHVWVSVCVLVCVHEGWRGWRAFYWHDQQAHMSGWVTDYRWCYSWFVIRLCVKHKVLPGTTSLQLLYHILSIPHRTTASSQVNAFSVFCTTNSDSTDFFTKIQNCSI